MFNIHVLLPLNDNSTVTTIDYIHIISKAHIKYFLFVFQCWSENRTDIVKMLMNCTTLHSL